MTAIETITKVCDLPHPAEVPTEITRTFSVYGKDYAIDVCQSHTVALDIALDKFVKHARPAHPKRWPKRTPQDRQRTADVRDWWAEHADEFGFPFQEFGRIPAEVTDQYKRAHA